MRKFILTMLIQNFKMIGFLLDEVNVNKHARRS